jgi:hypothetical protein
VKVQGSGREGRRKCWNIHSFLRHISPSASYLVDLNQNSFSKVTAFFFEHIVVELAESQNRFCEVFAISLSEVFEVVS